VCSGGASVIRRDGVERLHRESGPRVPSSAGNSPGVSNFAARRGAARRASGFAGLIFSRGVRGVRQRRRIANQARRISIGDEEAVKKLTVRNFRKKGKIRLRDEAALPPLPPALCGYSSHDLCFEIVRGRQRTAACSGAISIDAVSRARSNPLRYLLISFDTHAAIIPGVGAAAFSSVIPVLLHGYLGISERRRSTVARFISFSLVGSFANQRIDSIDC